MAMADRPYHARRFRGRRCWIRWGGDAFAGGFLCGLPGRRVQRGLDLGAAWALTAPCGNFAYVTRAEVEELLGSGDQEIQR